MNQNRRVRKQNIKYIIKYDTTEAQVAQNLFKAIVAQYLIKN